MRTNLLNFNKLSDNPIFWKEADLHGFQSLPPSLSHVLSFGQQVIQQFRLIELPYQFGLEIILKNSNFWKKNQSYC